MAEDLVLARGRTFLVTAADGGLDTSLVRPAGLFHADTRHLTRWSLTIDGQEPEVLSLTGDDTWWRSVSIPITGSEEGHPRPPWSLVRRRHLGAASLTEEIELVSYVDEPTTLRVQLAVDADFADQFALRWPGATGRGRLDRVADGSVLRLRYERDGFRRSTSVRATGEPQVDGHGLAWTVSLAPRQRWTAAITALAEPPDGASRPAATSVESLQEADAKEREAFLAGTPALDTDWAALERAYERGLHDLAALRLPVAGRPELAVAGAGLPWFLTLFGRDSLLTGLMSLPYLPTLSAGALVALAQVQGRVDDLEREEEPGKIVHEVREGELTACGDLPFGRYYGTVDATSLFLVLLEEYERWTGDDALVRELEPVARAALHWLDQRAGGYLTYFSHNPRGLANHCWKDSPGSIRFADGRTATGPIAVCEAQGYAYDAWRRAGRLARDVWLDEPLATRCDDLAADLQRRFVEDFWLPDRGFVALALDGEGRPVDSITSNPGHLLWSGILPHELGVTVGRRLLEPDLFSGWGVRTMSTQDAAYHPFDYHDGAVWPHDTALVAAGLGRYGLRDEAARLALAVVEAAGHFGDRLPEVFAGHDRAETGVPVRYPTACSPQAWAAAAPLSLVSTVLGRTPDGDAGPHLPDAVARLALTVRGRGLPV